MAHKGKKKKSRSQIFALEERMAPTLNINARDLKEVKTWPVGKTYKMVITAKMVRKSETEHDDGTNATFEIENIKSV